MISMGFCPPMISMGSSSRQGSVAFASAPTHPSSLMVVAKSSTRSCRAVAAAAALLSKSPVPPPSPNLPEDVLPWVGLFDGLAAANDNVDGAERGGGGGGGRSSKISIFLSKVGPQPQKFATTFFPEQGASGRKTLSEQQTSKRPNVGPTLTVQVSTISEQVSEQGPKVLMQGTKQSSEVSALIHSLNASKRSKPDVVTISPPTVLPSGAMHFPVVGAQPPPKSQPFVMSQSHWSCSSNKPSGLLGYCARSASASS